MRESLGRFPDEDRRDLIFGTYTHATMAATFVVETERWEAAERLLLSAEPGTAEGQAGGRADPMPA